MRQKIKQHLPNIERKYQKFNTGNNFKVLRFARLQLVISENQWQDFNIAISIIKI